MEKSPPKKGVEAGKDRAWDALAEADPATVCTRAAVTYDDHARCYLCPCLGQEIRVDSENRALSCDSPVGGIILKRLGYFSQIAILQYLTSAKSLPAAGRFVGTRELTAGQIYFRGSHVLPTDQLAAVFGSSADRFLERGKELGGRRLDYGDAAVQLNPLPRVPLAVVLWQGDEEFPARAGVLFDPTCEQQVVPEIVWSVAMLSVLAFFV